MNFLLILAGYFFILSADEARGLFLNSLFTDENALRDVEGDQSSEANKFREQEFPHRFLISASSIHTAEVKEPNQPLSLYMVRGSEKNAFSDRGYYQNTVSRHADKIDNGRLKERLRVDVSSSDGRESDEVLRKTDLPMPLWNNFYLRSHNVNRNIYIRDNENSASEPEVASSVESKLVPNQKDINSHSKNFKTCLNFHKNLNSVSKNQINLNFHHFKNLNRTSVNQILQELKPQTEPLGYQMQTPELVNNVKFPENEIISKFYSMINSADKLQKMKDADYYGINREPLPEAQRRHAKENLYTEDDSYKHIWNSKKWDFQRIHYTTITVGTLMLFLILVVMILALRIHCRTREKSSQEWIRHPVVQPVTATSDAIQPNFQHILQTDHLNAEPIRIKAKGLLERRGSNTSLTIDLGLTNEGADVVFSPSRECMNENFLMTAGNRMSRRQLRICLKDPRNLHAEFWQIPTNHPDKCSVPGAAAKNRYRTVLPNEETRVVLHRAPPDSPETPASQYINANYIRGFDGEEKAYIATQGPLAHTVEDLWLLVLQERSPAIVMITRLKEKGRVKCEPYIPSYSASYGSIQATVKQVLQKNGYTIRQIYLKHGDEVHTTLHFWFTSWPDHKTPSSARHLLAMSSEVEMARKENGGPAIIHCSAGIGRTGCFIGVSIGIKQLLEEDCVDVLNIVCQMRLDRGGMVQTAEQYEFIHRALALSEASLPYNSSN